MPEYNQVTCQYCGTPITPGNRFCSNCGKSTEGGTSRPTEYSVDAQPTSLQSGANFEGRTPPPPPRNVDSGTSYPGYQPQQEYRPDTPMYQAQAQAQAQVPGYAAAPPVKDSSRRVLGQVGCGLLVTILVILALCGGGGYFAYNWLAGAMHSTTDQANNTSTSTGSSNTDTTASAPKPVVTTLNTKPVTYASVNMSIKDVQQATSFPEDNNNKSGILRIDLSEENTSSTASYYSYTDSMLLTLPDNTSVHPEASKVSSGPDASIKRTNWVDFAVPTTVKPDQLTLTIGTSTESQIEIPLKADADLSKYQPITSAPNKLIQYAGANWTITNATKQTSYDAKQADKDSVFVVVKLKIDNTSQKEIYPFPSDTMRLQAGSTTNKPSSNTLNSSIAAGQMNSRGECVFIMPADSTDFTFELLPNDLLATTQPVTTTFQVK
ncbi:hypothetical protein KDW_52090 [Dictyobacter vulcani]|uniref:Zinc-ribbon domain-containing protein n=1 Tax=Dictyobacter vulcani TaxID=2607529 RepID=A0A5J4KWY9_9CHLR|nr:zinc ribbon domain-containing protein [Dictyobacter vulcani]GER91047.1 hypothetical protein KDW_52090 [Dictyobacter vulcani]